MRPIIKLCSLLIPFLIASNIYSSELPWFDTSLSREELAAAKPVTARFRME